MKGALIILVFLIQVGIVLYLYELRWRRRNPVAAPAATDAEKAVQEKGAKAAAAAAGESGEAATGGEDSGECCGLHLVCEKDSLSPMSDEVIYYDDEELDRFIGRDGGDYTPEETEEFRDVLMTLRPEDVAGWARSVTQRRLVLPPDVRDELLLLVNEQRSRRPATSGL